MGTSNESKFFSACIRNDVETVEEMLERGIDVNMQNAFDATPLHRAIHEDNMEVVRLLLEYGADVTIEDYYGKTPLQKAHNHSRKRIQKIIKKLNEAKELANDPTETVKLLLNSGTNVDIAGNNIEVVKLLLKHINKLLK